MEEVKLQLFFKNYQVLPGWNEKQQDISGQHVNISNGKKAGIRSMSNEHKETSVLRGKAKGAKGESRFRWHRARITEEILTGGLAVGDKILRLYRTTEGFRPDESTFLKPNLTTVCFVLFLLKAQVKRIMFSVLMEWRETISKKNTKRDRWIDAD